jgi:hypothetical protein
MFSFKEFGAVVAAVALISSPAAAAQIINLDLSAPDAGGYIYGSGSFDWPTEGNRATATLSLVGLELIDATLTGYVDGRATWWDDSIGGVTGNEYLLVYDCGVSNGCLSQVTPSLAIGHLSTPRGFDKPCTAATLGDCSFHYDPQSGIFDGYFRVTSLGSPYSATLSVSDFAAVPEPATWATMIIGFGLAGSAIRRRRSAGAAA